MNRRTILLAFALTPNRFGSMEIFGLELARQLQLRNIDVVFCFEGEPTPAVLAHFLAQENVKLVILPQQNSMGLSGIRNYYRLLRRYKPIAVMYWLGGVVRWWPLLGRLAGVRRTVYHDGTSRLPSTFRYKGPPHKRLLMKPLAASISVTQFIKSCSDREGIIPPHKSHVIYSAVDTTLEYGDGTAFRKRYGIPQDKIVVLNVSWLVPEKGIDVALMAASTALKARRDLHFVFCGDGANREEYQAKAIELGITDHVTWAGQVEDLARSGAFRAADMQIQCSQWHEAFCLAVAEGMSAGLPVIAARIGGLPELVSDGVNGFLFERTSNAELAAAILRLASDKDLRTNMGRQGRLRAVENHDLPGYITRWIKVLLPSEDDR